jgi:hypothetical protein
VSVGCELGCAQLDLVCWTLRPHTATALGASSWMHRC